MNGEVPDDVLFALLREHCPDRQMFIANVLQPYYEMGGQPYPFRPRGDLDRDAMGRAIQNVLEQAYVPEIIAISQSYTGRPMSDLGNELLNTLITSAPRFSLRDKIGECLRRDMYPRLDLDLASKIQGYTWRCFGRFIWRELQDRYYDSPEHVFLYFLGLEVIGDQARSTQVAELLAHMQHFLPICSTPTVGQHILRSEDVQPDPPTWVVVCS